jgi:prephenate dehydrogenase
MAHTIESVRADASHLFRSIQTDNPFAAEARERLLGALGEIHRHLSAGTAAGPILGGAPDIPDMGDRAPDLREIRDLIDDTDRELVRLLAQRDQLTHRAGRVKAREKRPIRDPQRERDMMVERRRWAEQEGMDPQTVEDLFRRILSVSRSVQRNDPQEPR